MRVIALTGATGFVGQASIRALQRNFPGLHLRLLVRNPETRRVPDSFDSCEIVSGSLDQPDALKALVDQAECVVHIAAAVRGNSANDFERDNIRGTRHLVEALSSHAPEAHLVHLSSLAARRPELSWYAASKRAGEEVVAQCRRFSILRPPAVYGPQDPALAGFWHLLARGLLVRAGGVDARFSLLHVDDLAEAICRLVDQGPTYANFSLAGPQPDGGWRWSDLADLARRRGGKRVRILAVPASVLSVGGAIGLMVSRIRGRSAMLSPGKARELLHRDWVCDNLRIEKYLNWTPTTRLEHALGTLPGWKNR